MAIMEKAGLEYTDYSKISYSSKNDFDGDLYSMFFPKGNEKDTRYYFDMEYNFDYTSNYKGDDDIVITTRNENGVGKVILFRDSFGNALYEFFANDFSEAVYGKLRYYSR